MVEPVFAQIKNNLRAGRFYERRGWISDGHRTFYPELGVADTRFRLSLSEGAVDREQPERGESSRSARVRPGSPACRRAGWLHHVPRRDLRGAPKLGGAGLYRRSA
jgi:hypothetical protein